MAWNSKVVWSEGMFLRPQHFQQQDRYFETLINGRSDHLRPYDWGITRLQLDRDVLSLGKVALADCELKLPDGTPVRVPDIDAPPSPLDVDAEWRDVEVVLALPLKRLNVAEVDRDGGPESVARYRAELFDARDNNVGMDNTIQIEIGARRLRLLPKLGDLSDYACVAVARIQEKRSDNTVVLDDQFIPPTLDCQAIPQVIGFIKEILGLLNQRGEALAARVSASGRGGVAEIADFLLLQTVNRWQPLFRHLSTLADLHPEAFYQHALMLAGEVATFTQASKRPDAFPVYAHDDLQNCLIPVMRALRQSFSTDFVQNAIQLPLQERRANIYVSPIQDRSLLQNSAFVLAVRADVKAESLLNYFPKQIKIGPVEHIRQLIQAALPGIELRPLPVAPRQIPFHTGTSYFELSKSGEHWKRMAESGGFAFHVGGKFPGLELAFWAIKG